jgi:type VI secretion system protein ImpK
MSSPDPFAAFESERTIIKPKPRAPGATGESPAYVAPPAASAYAADVTPMDMASAQILNQLVTAANTLLGLLSSLRSVRQAPNIPNLRASLTQAVQRFEADAQKIGLPNGHVVAARYMLCTALDEVVANTPWGAQAAWNKQSLLVQFHNETWGGEKVFQLLAKLSQDAVGNRNLLELMYCVIALGFEGRYRVIDNGRAQLDTVRQRLAEIVRKDRAAIEPDLSPHWRGQDMAKSRSTDGLPVWIVGAILALALALVYLAFRMSLNYRSDTTFAAVSTLRVPNVQIVATVPTPAKNPRLSVFLQPEIKAGLVTVLEESDRSIIRLRGDSFFSSGKAEPTTQSLPVLERIGQALAQVKGGVQVVGHSDNQPIRSLRFPSNWHLSSARAEGVRDALAAQVPLGRMRAVGKADAEPISTNDSAENRARNRRVDVILIPDQSSQEAQAVEVKK